MIWFIWILFSAAALAQTAAQPASADKPPPPPKPSETFRSAMEKQRASIAIQRETVRKQAEMAAQWQASLPGLEPAAVDCDALPVPELTPLIEGAAKRHQVDSKLLLGVIEQESAFHACAVSAKGAKGLMQLMPATVEQFNVSDVFDPVQNIEAGATFLRHLLDKYKGDLKLALAAYNAGAGAVDKSGGIPDIPETRDYVEAIMKKVR